MAAAFECLKQNTLFSLPANTKTQETIYVGSVLNIYILCICNLKSQKHVVCVVYCRFLERRTPVHKDLMVKNVRVYIST